MDWWSNFVDWAGSDRGWQVISGAVIPFVAIVVAGIVAALIGRGATKRVVALQEREARNAAVAGVISAARKAATWGSLGHDERSYADHLAEDADIRLRLLPIAGAPVAANWAEHEIADIKRNSSTFSFQADQSLTEFRDRMLEWQSRPSKARKLFRYDLERWKFETADPDADLVTRQQSWNADQADSARSRGGQTTTEPGSGAAPAAPAVPSANGGHSTEPALRERSTAAMTPARGSAPATAQQPSPAPAPTPTATAGRASSAATSQTAATDSAGQQSAAPHSAGQQSAAPHSAGQQSAGQQPVTQQPGATDVTDGEGQETGALTEPKVDASAPAGDTSTTSIPTRITDAPAEFADPHETDEAPYGSPVSASELRRRDQDDDE